MSDILIDKIETERLIISDAVLEECSELERVQQSWTDKKLVEGCEFDDGYFERCIKEGDLPPIEEADKSNYRLKSIYLKEEKNLIGFFDMYFGYPTKDCAWISIFVIDSSYRKNGYAQEVINMISNECKKFGFSKIGIVVYLNNWRALRFWTQAGFDKVTGIFCDGEYQENKYARIKLEKIL